MTSRYYTMTDSTGASGFLPTVTFTSTNNVFTYAQRITQLASIPGSPTGSITGFYEADFSGNITTIDIGAFQNDLSLVVVTINKVTSIGNSTFSGCTALRAITLDCAVDASGRYLLTSIGTNAFYNCTSLRNLHIPDTVKIIPDYMCALCSSLEVAVMGYGCASRDASNNYTADGTIGQFAFYLCSSLSYFVVPETVSSIGNGAFGYDTSLALVTILGRPTIHSAAFGSAMSTGATYYYDNSASYTTLTTVTSSALFPGATKRAYREIDLSGGATPSTLTYTTVNARLTALGLTAANSFWKGKILSTVTILADQCFRGAASPNGFGTTNFSNMVGLSFPSGLTSIGYTAFGNSDGTTITNCNVVGFYLPNSVTTFTTIGGNNYAFYSTNDAGRTSSRTRQIVFQSGNSSVPFTANMFYYTSAMAIIAPNVTSFGASCFDGAKSVQLYSFFQKNAYTATTRLDGPTDDTGKNAFVWSFNKGVPGYTHYVYIPKQITRMALELFRGIGDKIYVTAYHNYITTAGVTAAASGLGFGYFTYNATDGAVGPRFTGTAPTLNIIYNYVDAAGLTSFGSTSIANDANFLINVLYPSGVKTIGARFNGYTGLKSVTIPDTVTDICSNAFYSCTGLTNVYISPKSNLTIIYEGAMNNCTSLTSLFIPNSLKHIYAYGLFSCMSLATVTYGDNPGLKYIGANAFGGTAKALTSIFIPSSVVSIGNSAFLIGDPIAAAGNLNILNTVTFGAGSRLKSIGSTCFGIGSNNMVRSGQYLRDTVLPNTVRYMGSNVFQNTHRAAHSANFVVPSSLEVIPFALLFADGGSPVDVSNVYFPLSITTVAGPRIHYGYSLDGSLPGAEFYASKSGSLIYLPSHLSAYTGRSGYVFPNYSSTEAAGRTRSFYRTASFTTNPLTKLDLIVNVANTTDPLNTTQIHADIKEGVLVIGNGTNNITSLTGDGSRNLISVNIPSTVTTISANAFNGCTALAYVTFSENSKLTTIGNSAFLGCSLIPDIQLPDTLTTIGTNAFSGCNNLASISIPYNVTSIGANAFAGTFVRTRYVRLHQKLYNDISGSLSTYFPGVSASSFQVVPALILTNTLNPSRLTISQINNMYIRYRQSQLGFCTVVTVSATSGGSLSATDITNALPSGTGFVHLEIGSNVTSIANSAAVNNSRIYSIAIPNTVVTIGTSAFNGCTNLNYLSFHPDSVCTSIGNGAFLGNNIIDLALPDSLTTIADWSFQASNSLTSICIPKNVTSFGTGAFYFCPKLTFVALPASLITYAVLAYFSTNSPGNISPGTFTIYDLSAAIPHFKLSDYSMPNGIIQTVIDSAVTYIDHTAYAYYPDITLYAITTYNQTETAGPLNYVMNGIKMPFQPAAFLLNGGASNNFVSNSMFPIYRSVPDLNVFTLSSTAGNWPDDQDDYYILMPGYSICIYNNLYDEENLFTNNPKYLYYDNEFGKVPLNIANNGFANTTSSILIMYNGRILSKYYTS